jgi:hypothetical protein
MKESFFSARKAFPMRSFTLFVTFFFIDFDLQYARQTNAILNRIMDLFHNEIISFCQ